MQDKSKYLPAYPYLKHFQATELSFVTITKSLSNKMEKNILSRIELNVYAFRTK